jgi:GH25 family lysozyme M1 (1,4-beta-N-acetylmuramidase)
MIVVIDIFHGDNPGPNPIDFNAVKNFGVVGVIHKATEGTTDADPLYNRRRAETVAAGLSFGAYHFFHGTDPVAEADFFLKTAQPDKDTLVALDWENWPDDNHAPSAEAAQAFCQRIFDKLGRWPVLYSGNVAKEAISGKNAFFGNLKLWLCQYSSKWSVQESWTTPWLWQNSEASKIPGINGTCDSNVIIAPMTINDLKAQWAA